LRAVASIEFEHVTKRYKDGLEAVRDMSLEVRDGEFMILVGPSGSGKLAFGAVVGAGALALHQRHHRRARDAYTPEGIDRAAISVPPSPQADTA
jgi:ABC-type nitrate/sulfonate/bicarbonate transport system ATPase subunit